jgi:hypothetical protein
MIFFKHTVNNTPELLVRRPEQIVDGNADDIFGPHGEILCSFQQAFGLLVAKVNGDLHGFLS